PPCSAQATSPSAFPLPASHQRPRGRCWLLSGSDQHLEFPHSRLRRFTAEAFGGGHCPAASVIAEKKVTNVFIISSRLPNSFLHGEPAWSTDVQASPAPTCGANGTSCPLNKLTLPPRAQTHPVPLV